MKQALIAIWACVFLLLASGAAMAVSPLYIDGGLLNWLNPPGENWIGYLANIAFSVVFGVLLFLGGVALSVTAGMASSLVAVSKPGNAASAEPDNEA